MVVSVLLADDRANTVHVDLGQLAAVRAKPGVNIDSTTNREQFCLVLCGGEVDLTLRFRPQASASGVCEFFRIVRGWDG